MSKTVLFQIIQFSISMQFCSIWHIDRTLSGAITPGQSGPGSNVIERVLHIPRSSRHCYNLTIRLFSFISRTLVEGGGSYLSAEVRSVYFTTPANCAWTFLEKIYSLMPKTYIYIKMKKNGKTNGNISFMLFIFWLFLTSFKLRSLSGEKFLWKKKEVFFFFFQKVFKMSLLGEKL